MRLWDLKMGPEKKLRSYDEFLLCLTELKLGLLNRDLAYDPLYLKVCAVIFATAGLEQ